jgi:hypothetical protein
MATDKLEAVLAAIGALEKALESSDGAVSWSIDNEKQIMRKTELDGFVWMTSGVEVVTIKIAYY